MLRLDVDGKGFLISLLKRRSLQERLLFAFQALGRLLELLPDIAALGGPYACLGSASRCSRRR